MMRSTVRSGRRGGRAHVGAHGPEGNIGAALDLLERSRFTLAAAGRATTADERYIEANLGALRAAAALVAARAGIRRRGPVWAALAARAPELAEWGAYWEVGARRRREVESGLRSPSSDESDKVLQAGETFLGLVQAALGLPVTPMHAGSPRSRAEQASLAAGA